MIDPFQCRAARAYLGWSQDELQGLAGVAKKTIADFERDARRPHERTLHTLEHTFIAHGIEFIPQNGGGSGIRLKRPLPRLFRRDHVVHRDWVAFAFDYRDKRVIGFIECAALASISLSNLPPVEVFDREKHRILMVAAGKADQGEFDPEGRVLVRRGDIEIVEFDPKFKVLKPE